MKKIKIIILLLIIGLGFLYYFYVKTTSTPYLSNGTDTEFTIKAGESVEAISDSLKEKGIIGSPQIFKYYVRQIEAQSDLKAGTYILNPSLSMREIVEILVSGLSQERERSITIIEGWKISDIEKYLSEEKVTSAGEFEKFVELSVGEWKFDFEKPSYLESVPENVNLEGFLYPDTYRIFTDASAQDVVEKMLDNFGNKITSKMLSDIEAQKKNLYDIIILASIIEREVFGDEDRKIVSGILNKRMDIGMLLQVDSTINYITGKNDPSAEYADLEIDSPYNTYKYLGLPPGPISNPSISSISAAIYPQASDYLFYLNRQDTGETIFSRNLDEHNSNKYKYLK